MEEHATTSNDEGYLWSPVIESSKKHSKTCNHPESLRNSAMFLANSCSKWTVAKNTLLFWVKLQPQKKKELNCPFSPRSHSRSSRTSAACCLTSANFWTHSSPSCAGKMQRVHGWFFWICGADLFKINQTKIEIWSDFSHSSWWGLATKHHQILCRDPVFNRGVKSRKSKDKIPLAILQN